MPRQITTLSQLGARLSIAKWHISLLSQHAAGDGAVNHIVYVVDPNNTQLQEFAHSLPARFTVLDRNDNTWTNFRQRDIPSFGGDVNYDFLIRRPETGDIFLTLHDDTLLHSADAWDLIRNTLKAHQFGGYLDSRDIPGYDRIFLDGVPLSKLRIGTWFCFGLTRHYLDRGYTIGDYHNYLRYSLNVKYRTLRIRTQGLRSWLNGGFDLNLRARLAGDSFHIIDDGYALAEHWTKVTGFFSKRNLLEYVDTPDEIDRWRDRLTKLAQTDTSQFVFDLRYLSELANALSANHIDDPLLNPSRILEFRGLHPNTNHV
jgi:hypothetical protein